MSSNADFDRWYAAKKTRIVVAPSHELETFGNTLVNYHIVSELEDYPGKVRIREGRLEAHRPQVITPNFSGFETEGLGPEAREYLEFLREHEDEMRILRYGYSLKSDNFSEQIVTDSTDAVIERVKAAVEESGDRFSAVIRGVDEPWDICLVQLFWHEVRRSAGRNIRELQEHGDLFRKD